VLREQDADPHGGASVGRISCGGDQGLAAAQRQGLGLLLLVLHNPTSFIL
jgi:hypothetical protein